MFYAWTVVLILNHGYSFFFFCISFFYVNMYRYAEQEVENFFFIQSEILIAVLFMNMISLISFVLQYKEGSPGVNLVVVVGGGGQGTSPPSISPFGWKSSWCTGNHWWLEQTPLRQSFPPPENYWISHRFLGKNK